MLKLMQRNMKHRKHPDFQSPWHQRDYFKFILKDVEMNEWRNLLIKDLNV